MEWIPLAFILFLIMDPVGNISSYLTLVKELPRKDQKRIIIREMLIALALMLLFIVIGDPIMDLLHISEIAVEATAGLLLFLIGLKILFVAHDNPRLNLPQGEPFIVPFAIPLIAGPSTLATIMIFAHVESITTMVLAIVVGWFASILILFYAPVFKRVLGTSGLVALERLMAMVLILIATQRILDGVKHFVAICA